MSELEIKYPVKANKTHHQVTEQAARVATKIIQRADKLSPEQKESADLRPKLGGGKAEVTHKNIRIATTGNMGRPSTWIDRTANGSPEVRLRLSAGGADTMHGFLAKGEIEEPEFGRHELTGEETVHHLALNLAEVRNAVSQQESVANAAAAQKEAAKQAAIGKLYS